MVGEDIARREFCICGAVADFECSRCENQGYCSPHCQQADWPRHMLVCQPRARPTPVRTVPFNTRISGPSMVPKKFGRTSTSSLPKPQLEETSSSESDEELMANSRVAFNRHQNNEHMIKRTQQQPSQRQQFHHQQQEQLGFSRELEAGKEDSVRDNFEQPPLYAPSQQQLEQLHALQQHQIHLVSRVSPVNGAGHVQAGKPPAQLVPLGGSGLVVNNPNVVGLPSLPGQLPRPTLTSAAANADSDSDDEETINVPLPSALVDATQSAYNAQPTLFPDQATPDLDGGEMAEDESSDTQSKGAEAITDINAQSTVESEAESESLEEGESPSGAAHSRRLSGPVKLFLGPNFNTRVGTASMAIVEEDEEELEAREEDREGRDGESEEHSPWERGEEIVEDV